VIFEVSLVKSQSEWHEDYSGLGRKTAAENTGAESVLLMFSAFLYHSCNVLFLPLSKNCRQQCILMILYLR